MEEGDLVVIPAGTGYDQSNEGTEPAIWLDGLDLGLLKVMGADVSSRSPLGGQYQAIHKAPGSFSRTRGQMRASWASSEYARPLVRYAWTDTSAALTATAESEGDGDPSDGIHLFYPSPADGGPTLPTFSCEIQLLNSGVKTRAHRHNSTTIYYAFRGEGCTHVGGEPLEWAEGDIFSIPPWAWHHHENGLAEQAILYSIDDWPAMAKMGFHREERRDSADETSAYLTSHS